MNPEDYFKAMCYHDSKIRAFLTPVTEDKMYTFNAEGFFHNGMAGERTREAYVYINNTARRLNVFTGKVWPYSLKQFEIRLKSKSCAAFTLLKIKYNVAKNHELYKPGGVEYLKLVQKYHCSV